ncbi:MAG: DUF262 domain-containing protein [Synergistaceae bacterium]|nr:DUF262 domain-containing protein [Synergistaceae bacterium]
MKLNETNILSILNANMQFVLPIYQQHYCWEKEQCNQLWKDIVRMQKDRRNNHFIGSIVNIDDINNKFTLIDGQQRMTTFTLILIVLRDYARSNPDSGIDAAEIENKYLRNNDASCKLILTGGDEDILINLVSGKADSYLQRNSSNNQEDEEVAIPKLIVNYKFFKQKIVEARNPELTPKQVYEALGKLKIVNIKLGNDDDPQAIFESLNSSGKDLSKSDLIRNFVLMSLDRRTMTRIYNNYWSKMEELFGDSEKNTTLMDDFFKDYITMYMANIPNEEQLYETFKTWFYDTTRPENVTVSTICSDIYKKAQDYTNIIFARHTDTEFQSVYSEIRELKMEVSYPFLLKIHADFRRGVISKEQLLQIMYMCISYVVRRDVCSLSSNSMNQTFARLRRRINAQNYVESIKTAFSELRDNQRFPNNQEFFDKFVSCKLVSKQRCKYILGMLENFDRDINDSINPKNFRVERVMPETLLPRWAEELGANAYGLHERYVDTIANLTIVEPKLEIIDNSFIDKKHGLRNSQLKLNSYIYEQHSWTQDTLVNRKNLL